MPRFYLSEPLCPQNRFRLPENIVRHIHVLRLKAGDAIVLFDGTGNNFPAVLTELDKRQIHCQIGQPETAINESPLDITLIQAISSGDRMDFTLQKSVELGVKRIIPLISSRCVVRLSGERADKRVQRWQEIVIAACEQSGRATVPQVSPIMMFPDYLAQITPQNGHLLMSLHQAKRLGDIAPVPPNIHLMIGPEGGWSCEEEHAAIAAGCQAITLGPRVLRTETASLAAIAAMQTLWGDF